MDDDSKDNASRRDFIFIATGAVGAAGVAALAWPLVAQMGPAADTLADAGLDVDLSQLEEGQQMLVPWRGQPIYIRHRTPAEIAAAQADDNADMIDPQTDQERLRPKRDGTYDPRFLVMNGKCTHMGCPTISESGRYDGWFCACHSAHFDTSGRVRSAPAPKNMQIPPYKWISETAIKLQP